VRKSRNFSEYERSKPRPKGHKLGEKINGDKRGAVNTFTQTKKGGPKTLGAGGWGGGEPTIVRRECQQTFEVQPLGEKRERALPCGGVDPAEKEQHPNRVGEITGFLSRGVGQRCKTSRKRYHRRVKKYYGGGSKATNHHRQERRNWTSQGTKWGD